MDMPEKKPFYITTTLPYVNSDPHIGFALEIVHVDVIARYKKLSGYDVFFNTGTDEHGQKIYEKAFENSVSPQEHVDEYVKRFENLKDLLNLDYTHFIRTTNPHHKEAAQEFWKRADANGDIYKKKYKTKYCVGCELERQDSEIEDGRCFLHPNLELQIVEEENYFFRFSKYQDALLKLYKDNPRFVIPDTRLKEIKTFVEGGLHDFSISRLKEKMPWGVPVPGDEEHVMYVWFDALVNYISTLGWPDDEDNFTTFWTNGTPVQYAGKDNLRQQSAMWQAMLLSAGLPPSHTIVIHGFITSEGKKMSKSLGNVINPRTVVEQYGAEALRYFLAREIHPFEDSDFTMDRFHESYTANLVNGLGNQVNRVMQMAETHLDGPVDVSDESLKEEFGTATLEKAFTDKLDGFDIQAAADIIWKHIGVADTEIQEQEPFKKVKSDDAAVVDEAKVFITRLVKHLWFVAMHLEPILPKTAEKIKQAIKENKKPVTPLFERII